MCEVDIEAILNEFRLFGCTLDALATDTQHAYAKLIKCKIFTDEQLKDVNLSDFDRNRITALVVKPIKFIIFGDSTDLRVSLANAFLKENLESEGVIEEMYRESCNIFVQYDSVKSWQKVPKETFPSLLNQRSSFVDNFDRYIVQIKGPFSVLKYDVSMVLLNAREFDKTIFKELRTSAFCIWLYAFRDKIVNECAVEILQDVLGLDLQLIETSWFSGSICERKSKRESKFYDFCELDPLGFSPLSTGFDLHGILLSYAMKAQHPLLQSQKQCLACFIDVLSLISADRIQKETRLQFAVEKEYSLYKSLLALSNSKQREIADIVSDALREVRKNVYEWLEEPISEKDALDRYGRFEHDAFNHIQSFILHQLNYIIGDKIMDSANVFKQNYILALTKCLEDLDFLENENSNDSKKMCATSALCQIISSVYNLDLDAFNCMNIFKLYLEKIRMVLTMFTFEESRQNDIQYSKYAEGLLNSISERRLARSVCKRLHDQVHSSHNAFVRAINQLKQTHFCRSVDAEENQRIVKKDFTPSIALLQLRTISAGFLLQYGKPNFGEELGRGRFGVVYACKSWGPYEDVALKTVVAVDETHLKDAAIEFHCNMIVPEHPRIIRFYGSVITKYRSSASTEQLIIVMQRLNKDLYSALEEGMPLKKRILIAIEVIEGIRYLHLLGLVHRDIKLKNILLDSNDHVKLTDMGFCKPGVLMDGSLVGTPIHMAPEIFSSNYDYRIDVYAFGILLWHIASGRVEMPKTFSCFSSPLSLWEAVKLGLRPEKLPSIDEELWNIAENCWQTNPDDRLSTADIQQKLELIYKKI